MNIFLRWPVSTLPIPSSAETWKTFKKRLCQIFQADMSSEKNPYFGKHLFAKQDRLRVRDFATGKNSSFTGFAITKSFAFFLGNAIL